MNEVESLPPPARRLPKPEDFPASGPNALANVGVRALAWCIDFGLTSAVALVAVAAFIDWPEVARDGSGSFPLWASGVGIAVWVVYQTVLVWRVGSTLGLWALSMRVARYTDGRRPGLDQAVIRALVPAASAAVMVPLFSTPWFLDAGWILPYLGAISSPLRRGFHDQAGGTLVIRTR